MANLAKLISDSWSESTPNHDLLHSDQETISRYDFLNLVAYRCDFLKISKGQRVLVSSGRGFCFFVDLYAVWAAGCVVIPFDPSEGCIHKEQLHEIAQADVVVDDVYALSIDKKYTVNYINVDIDGVSAILFTSGTTGKPKGVELSTYSLIENSKGILNHIKMSCDRLFINIPFHFTSAICHFLACSLSGSTLIGIETRLMYFDYINAIIALKPTGLGGAPVQFRWVSDYCKAEGGGHFNNLDFIVSSGDHLPVPVINSLRANLPSVRIDTVYGLTEVGGRFCILESDDLDSHVGSVGKPIDGLSYRIVDPDSEDILSPGDEGEIVISGELLAKGYCNNINATLKSFTNLGFRTGDIGHLDEDGYLYLKGRSDDVFKVNGKKVSGVLVTQGLMETRMFSDAAVVPVEFPLFGTVPVAFVVLGKDVKFEKGKTLKKLRELLPGNHIPHEFHILTHIPRTGSGKVKKNDLRSILE